MSIHILRFCGEIKKKISTILLKNGLSMAVAENVTLACVC